MQSLLFDYLKKVKTHRKYIPHSVSRIVLFLAATAVSNAFRSDVSKFSEILRRADRQICTDVSNDAGVFTVMVRQSKAPCRLIVTDVSEDL